MRNDALGVFYRRDDGILPEILACLRFVAEFPPPFHSGENCLPKAAVFGVGCSAGLEEPRILPPYLFERIAGSRGEFWIDVFDGPVAVGDNDDGGALLHGLGQLAQHILGTSAEFQFLVFFGNCDV